MKILFCINFAIAAIFVACSLYQAVYALVRLLGKRRGYRAEKLCRYAVLIAARNEEQVIGQLLDSIRRQDYPAELLDVFVAADNCTDQTAAVARDHGATVWERFSKEHVGKGYALSFLLDHIQRERGTGHYDGYFVFDADNLLDPCYITEMNKVFSCGSRVVTSYRNSKNFGENWITAGYGLWFLHESEYLNHPRSLLGVSCIVSGTGFLFADSLLQEIGGWNYHLLTEDLEFTADLLIRGEKVAYCPDAILYDEQPATLKDSLTQRSRWIKGYFQVLARHGGSLLRTLKTTGSFDCYDMLMNSIPAAVLTIVSVLTNAIMFLVGILTAPQEMGIFFLTFFLTLFNSYSVLYIMGLLALITENRRICCSARKKALYSFTFPLFVYTYCLAMLMAIFSEADWKPIPHSAALSISDLKNDAGNR